MWLRLEDASGNEVFVSTDDVSLASSEASSPMALARRIVDFIELRPLAE